MSKVGVACSSGEDEIVIIEYPVFRSYLSSFDINRLHLGEDDFDVFAFAQDCAHRAELTFTPYAEAYCTQQNAQSSGETVQGHCERQGVSVAFLATSSVVDEKRKAQTPAGQSSASRQHRCGASKGESSFRLRRNSGILACSIAQASQPASLLRVT